MTILACTVMEKFHYLKNGKKIGEKQGRAKEKARLNPTIQHIVFNLHSKYDYSSLHSCGKSLTQNFIIQRMERKKIGEVRGRISRKALVLNPTIQHVIFNLHTKYDYSRLHGCGEFFDQKGTDERLAGTDRCKPVFPHFFEAGV